MNAHIYDPAFAFYRSYLFSFRNYQGGDSALKFCTALCSVRSTIRLVA